MMLSKDEKLKSLKELVDWFKVESIRLATNIEMLTEENKSQSLKLREAQQEVKVWQNAAEKNKAYNMILKDTIEKMKLPAFISKYEQQGINKYLKNQETKKEEESNEFHEEDLNKIVSTEAFFQEREMDNLDTRLLSEPVSQAEHTQRQSVNANIAETLNTDIKAEIIPL